MKNFFFLSVVWIALLGCDQLDNEPQSLHAYFDMDSLIDAQILALTQNQVTLKKTVKKDDEQETKSFDLDSAGWEKEFEILRSFNINKPRNVGSYGVIEKKDSVIYAPIQGMELPVQQFVLTYHEGQLSAIDAWFTEFKYIYYTDRRINLTFENGLLSKYEIKGTQNMIILKAVEYQILGIISE